MDTIAFITDSLLEGARELERQPPPDDLRLAYEALRRHLVDHYPIVLTGAAEDRRGRRPPRRLIIERLRIARADQEAELVALATRLHRALARLADQGTVAARRREETPVAPMPSAADEAMPVPAAPPPVEPRGAPAEPFVASRQVSLLPGLARNLVRAATHVGRLLSRGFISGRALGLHEGPGRSGTSPFVLLDLGKAGSAPRPPPGNRDDAPSPSPPPNGPRSLIDLLPRLTAHQSFYGAFLPDEDEAPAACPPPPERIIDAHLLAPSFAPGQIAGLTVTLRLPESRSYGQFRGSAVLEPDDGPVTVGLQAQGFTILSEPPAPLSLVPDRDSAPAAFQLRIEQAAERWLHVVLIQAGRSVGELAIHDFASLEARDQKVSAPLLRVREADLTLIVRAAESRAIVSSPRDRACLDYREIAGIQPLRTPFQSMLRDRLRALYDTTSNAEDTEHELRVVGVELANCLSPELTALLRRSETRTVMLRHDEDFDFPIELCFLDDATDPFFVGDRIAICRWYLGVTNPPDVVSKRVERIAFLRGEDEAADPDAALLERLYPGRLTLLESAREVRDRLFKTSDFDLIQFTGHCMVNDKGLGGLAMQDGSFIRMIDIGQLMAERQFAKAQPFVLLNACASAQPYVGLTARDSFAHRFVAAEACAFIGTLWPVAGAVAKDFTAAFHDALRHESVGGALLKAKLAVVARAAEAADKTPQSDLAAIARQVAARSYCLFAHPDLRLAA